jgi:hypothetical protein
MVNFLFVSDPMAEDTHTGVEQMDTDGAENCTLCKHCIYKICLFSSYASFPLYFIFYFYFYYSLILKIIKN